VIREQIGKNLHQIINTIYLIPIFYEDSLLNTPSLGGFEMFSPLNPPSLGDFEILILPELGVRRHQNPITVNGSLDKGGTTGG
jgi:hypothetical protein